MTTNVTPVAKSLHTVTVIKQVARLHQKHPLGFNNEDAVDAAMVVLGLAGRPDPYGLKAMALKMMAKEDSERAAAALASAEQRLDRIGSDLSTLEGRRARQAELLAQLPTAHA